MSDHTVTEAQRSSAGHNRPPVRFKGSPLFRAVPAKAFWVYGSAALVLIVAVWWIVSGLELVNPYFLPSPDAVWRSGAEMWSSGQLQSDTWTSFSRILVGFLISTVIALPVGCLMGTLWRYEASLEPVIDFVRYMPAVAFVPLTIAWFGVGELQKYSIIFIGTFFQQVLMVTDNVKRVPREYVQIGQTLGMNTFRCMCRIVLPNSAPGIWDTLRITLGWAWTWLVVAELVAAQSGLGQRILVAQRYFETGRIFFIIILIGVIGLLLDQLMKQGGRRLFPWAAS